MITTLRWIGSLSSALQAGLDRAVSAELHSITSDIYRSKIAAVPAADRTLPVSGRDEASAVSEKMAA